MREALEPVPMTQVSASEAVAFPHLEALEEVGTIAGCAISSNWPSSNHEITDKDLMHPALYLNRELTWLNFNLRVLNEAEDTRTPLLERVKFIAIACGNLDEFFMKRIGGLKQQIGAGLNERAIDGRTPQEQILACYELINFMEDRKTKIFETLMEKLENRGIYLLQYRDLKKEEQQELREFYLSNIYPLITPQGIDPAHPFPFISNLSLNLLVTLRHPGHGEISLARVKVPVGQDIPRFLRLSSSNRFVRIEDVMAGNLDLLFPRMEVMSCEVFRVTRNAVTELDEEQAEDLLSMIETELRYRKFAPVVRLQIDDEMDPVHRGMLMAELGVQGDCDVFVVDGMVGKKDLFEIASLDIPHLKDPAHFGIDHPRLKDSRKIFYLLRETGSILLFHPYESFATSVERFLTEASIDPKVRAIKMTLYRTSKDSNVIQCLINAARNGKQVTVVVEIKARFDEAANINWANQLEEAGIHVTYGVVGLKTHSKVILVVRKDYNGLRRYAHIGTGNYHAGTAKVYTDVGLLTADPEIGADLTEFFNYLSTGFTPRRNYKKLIVSPSDLKRALLEKIQREIELHSEANPAKIRFKMNGLEDPDIVRALYRASRAGVQIELIVRDSCRLRPGIKGVSENITVISIVGRFLEHARIYYFRAGGAEEYFFGSADCMKRNLESRVEVLVPIEDPHVRRDLERIFSIQLEDRRNAWVMRSDGTYQQRRPVKENERKGSQRFFIEIADRRQKAAGRLKRLKSQGKSKKEFWAGY